MSATTAQPMTGHANKTASLGALAILVGALALGAVGVAIGQGYKSAPAAGFTPAQVQAALYAQRMGEKAPLFTSEESLLIRLRGDYNDRGKDVPAAVTSFPSPVSPSRNGHFRNHAR